MEKKNCIYSWAKPFQMVLLPVIQVGQVSERAAVGRKGAVHKQAVPLEVVVFQLCVVLVVELDRIKETPLRAIPVTQVDNTGVFLRHVGKKT